MMKQNQSPRQSILPDPGPLSILSEVDNKKRLFLKQADSIYNTSGLTKQLKGQFFKASQKVILEILRNEFIIKNVGFSKREKENAYKKVISIPSAMELFTSAFPDQPIA